ncbi:four-carbon acid sugar kinase family protein, partial [Ahrensia kielensis]|uniref:four-carbon acid sugar kinase family protein n=1 Tax=Ahrensia kielensis TaxID=76980 RepID=UPI0005AB4483
GMRNHPLTPMTDADLRRWLSYQTKWNVGHIALMSFVNDLCASKHPLAGFNVTVAHIGGNEI